MVALRAYSMLQIVTIIVTIICPIQGGNKEHSKTDHDFSFTDRHSPTYIDRHTC